VNIVRPADFVTPSKTDGKKHLEWSWATSFLQSQYEMFRDLTGEDIQFSLDGCDYLNPDGLLWVLLFGEQLKKRDNVLWLDLPSSPKQIAYIRESRFVEVVQDIFSISDIFRLDEAINRPIDSGFAFYSRIDMDTFSGLLSRIGDLFKGKRLVEMLGIPPLSELHAQFMPSLMQIINETGKNVVQHSGGVPYTGAGYFAVDELGPNAIRFCIVDAGCGFASSLKGKGIEVRDDYDAIQHALLFRLHRPSGEGLFRVIQLLNMLNGVLTIRSGSSQTFLNPRKMALLTDGEIESFVLASMGRRFARPKFPGVQLQIDMRQRRSR
jgi:hypothetical protein